MTLFDKAAEFAIRAHSGMLRKISRLPYVIHPFEVASIASTMTNDEELLSAALLHDTLEDTDTTEKDLVLNFGEKVTHYVLMETEDRIPDVPRVESWQKRKEKSLSELEASDDIKVKILWLSDKLSNMRSFYQSWKIEGNALWNRMNQRDVSKQAWYYRSIARLTSELKDYDAWKEYNSLVEMIFKGVD